MSEARSAPLLAALFAASLAGTCVVMVQHILAGLLMFLLWDIGSVISAIRGGRSIASTALPFVLILTVALGGPIWWGLRATGLRGRLAMTVASGFAAGLLGLIVAVLMIAFMPWAAGFAPLVLAAPVLPGAAAGWTLHRVAYGANPKA
ncbi:MAG: hypothetical protein REJ23_08450 [Brevundimonas sp.]|nr:hypothetical protein [Brevundimonas sp.]